MALTPVVLAWFRYKADPFVVKVWDIGGASVGMLALPLMLMFVGLELQGDLPPSNYKPLSVFVGAVNIFTSSIFLCVIVCARCRLKPGR